MFAHLSHSLTGRLLCYSSRHTLITRSVDRDDSSSPNSTILVVSRSIPNPSSDSVDIPPSSTKAQLDLSGYLLTPLTDTSVKITQITQLDLAAPDLSAPLLKILTAEYATTASRIAEFIDDEGYAPSFLRWGEGPATLERASEGSLRKGEVTFLVGGEGKGTMKDGQQKAWLQYSDKMYERGLAIRVEPEGAATVAKVDGCERTVEFVWSEKVREGGVKVVLSQADEDGADDVLLGGEYLDRTVGMEKGSGAKKKAPVPSAATRRTSTNEDTRSNGSETTMVDEQPSKSKVRPLSIDFHLQPADPLFSGHRRIHRRRRSSLIQDSLHPLSSTRHLHCFHFRGHAAAGQARHPRGRLLDPLGQPLLHPLPVRLHGRCGGGSLCLGQAVVNICSCINILYLFVHCFEREPLRRETSRLGELLARP